MNKIKPIYLVLISALLLVVGWPPLPTAFLLFIAFVPLLFVHEQLKNNSKKHLKFWLWSYLCIFLFNLGTTWWVWNASASGAIMMLVFNSLIISLPFLLFSFTNSLLPKSGYQSLVLYYLAMEYVHFNWSASWPWLTLGKGLAVFPAFIQWYEYTGEMGGTLFILLLNIMVFKVVQSQRWIQIWKPAILVLALYGISFFTALQYFELYKGNGIEVVISQPNIDPYKEKFSDGDQFIPPMEQMDIAMEVAKPLITPSTALLLLPETAAVGYLDVHKMEESLVLNRLATMSDTHAMDIITGAETYEVYHQKNQPTLTAREDESSGIWWDSYNTAILLNNGHAQDFYHKSRLVPGVEKMPFPFLENLSINLGGASGSLGTSPSAKNFILKDSQVVIAPLICYESVFGDYATEFVRNGATLLAVITNDAWWGNTPGYKQHLLFGSIRCIETRREMVRSANTGISAKINHLGRITQQTKYNERTAIKCYVRPRTELTFYVKYGNVIGKMALFLAIVLLLSSVVKKFVKKSY
jgi:apolipoprotein N-acyltransferase